jgi:hypothetical protein
MDPIHRHLSRSLSVRIAITEDTARPALRELRARLATRAIAEAMGRPLRDLVSDHFCGLPANKQGFPSIGFWQDASEATRFELGDDGVTIVTDKIGVRQRYFGGLIAAGVGTSSATGQPTGYLTIAAVPEAYGKRAAELGELKFVRFGRGSEAHCALVRVAPKVAARKGGAPTDKAIAQTVIYWLRQSVWQEGNPAVLPGDEEFADTIVQVLDQLLQA